MKKLYRECPKSYRLLCRRGHLESERKAIQQLFADHPEVFWLDETDHPVCCVFEVKHGLYIAKDRKLYSGRWVTRYDSFGKERSSRRVPRAVFESCLRELLYGDLD